MRTHDINSNCIGIYSADKKVLQVALTVTDHKILVILLKAIVYPKFGFWKHEFQIFIFSSLFTMYSNITSLVSDYLVRFAITTPKNPIFEYVLSRLATSLLISTTYVYHHSAHGSKNNVIKSNSRQ